MKLFKNFRDDESGAVTVDFVVLTAAIIVLGGTAITTISNGVGDLSTDIDTALKGVVVTTE